MKSCNNLLLSTLAGLGLLACSAEPMEIATSDDKSDTPSATGDLVRFQVEIVGEGQVAVLEPYVEVCTTEDGICTFTFERGTRVAIEAAGVVEAGDAPALDCTGPRICRLQLDENLTIVADFEFSGHRISGPRPFGFLPGEPWIIIDPFHGEDELQQGLAPQQEQMTED